MKNNLSFHCTVTDAIASVVIGEPALLTTILSFLTAEPDDQDDQNDQDPCVVQPVVVLQTIKTLCQTIPGLSNHVGPTNEAFWRERVLTDFNFTTDEDERFNVEDCASLACEGEGEMGIIRKRDVNWKDEDDVANWKAWCAHPAKPAMDAWIRKQKKQKKRYGDPEYILGEDLQYWSKLKAYYRPSQYQFLSAIQRDRTLLATQWPEKENAFSLYCDLVLLQRLDEPWIEGFDVSSDGDYEMIPCLLSRVDRNISEGGYELLDHCGFLPHFWWMGDPSLCINQEEDAESNTDRERQEEEREEEEREEEEEFPFSASDIDIDTLRQLVHVSFNDWRRIHINKYNKYYSEVPSPDYYIGQSKHSDRWLGFVGESQYA